MYRAIYKKLLALYPRTFRERFGDEMQQTFNDLCNEADSNIFRLWLLAETLSGAVRENMIGINPRHIIKNITSPKTAALISFLLALPLGLIALIFFAEIKPLIAAANYFLTTDGQQVNMLGRAVMVGGIALLPVAFGLNLVPVIKTARSQGRFFAHPVNLFLGAAILLLISTTVGGLLMETIRCDVIGITPCD